MPDPSELVRAISSDLLKLRILKRESHNNLGYTGVWICQKSVNIYLRLVNFFVNFASKENCKQTLNSKFIISMLKYLGGSVLISTTYFKVYF